MKIEKISITNYDFKMFSFFPILTLEYDTFTKNKTWYFGWLFWHFEITINEN